MKAFHNQYLSLQLLHLTQSLDMVQDQDAAKFLHSYLSEKEGNKQQLTFHQAWVSLCCMLE